MLSRCLGSTDLLGIDGALQREKALIPTRYSPVFEKSHKFVKSKVENNYNCGNLKRTSCSFLADESKGNSVSAECEFTLMLKLTDGLGRRERKDVNVIMAAKRPARGMIYLAPIHADRS